MAKKIDDAKWHYSGDFPRDLAQDAGATHIGMFFAWAALSGRIGKKFSREMAIELQKFRSRDVTPGRFILDVSDGALLDVYLDPATRKFAFWYYDEDLFFTDYDRVLGGALDSLYHVPDTWESFDELRPAIDDRLEQFLAILRGH